MMSDMHGMPRQQALVRGIVLGLVVLVGYLVAAGGLWALGAALGLSTIASFFVAACIAPVLVSAGVLWWVLTMPEGRRQALLGIEPVAPGADDAPDA